MTKKNWLLGAATGAILIGSLIGIGCKSSSTSNAKPTKTAQVKLTPTKTTTSSTPKATATRAPGTATGAGAHAPSSCNAIPTSLISPYIGGGAVTTQSLQAAPNAVSCEFANSGASTIVIINIGPGTAATFATLQTTSGGGGRTITPVTGIGSSAFSTSKNGVPGGLDVLTAQGLIFSVSANLTLAQDQALIQALINLF